MSSDVVASRMSTHIDGLARALASAGAPASESARLLELAAIAAMHVVSLAEVSAERPEPALRAERWVPAPAPARPQLAIAG